MADKTTDHGNAAPEEDFGAVLPLPTDDSPVTTAKPITPNVAADNSPAVEMVRKKLSSVYKNEPSEAEEELAAAFSGDKESKSQKFLRELAKSGQTAKEKQIAWHEYYAGLTDEEKQQVWQEFENLQSSKSSYKKESGQAKNSQLAPAAFKPAKRQAQKIRATAREAKRTITMVRGGTANEGLRSLAFGLGIGLATVIILMFGFFNERFIAPFLQPSRSVLAASLINGSQVSKDPVLIVPKINLEVPVVYGVTTTTPDDVQKALQSGVVHYADTALPGQNGNLVIVGHSSNNILNPGKYKFAFVLLHKLTIGDTFFLQYHGKRYVYQVYKREIVPPTDTSVLANQNSPATATLITCDPPGTSTNRLVVVGKQISPAVSGNSAAKSNNNAAISTAIIPGNSPSLWSRIYNWLSR